MSPALYDATQPLLPGLDISRDIAKVIALAVAQAAINAGVADEASVDDLKAKIAQRMWSPSYPQLANRD